MLNDYSIRDIIQYRDITWGKSDDFLYLTEIPVDFEPNYFKPNYFSYGLLEKGNIKIEIDQEVFSIGNQSLLVYRPGQVVRILNIEPGTKGAFILFTKRFLDSLNENIFSISQCSFLSYRYRSHLNLHTNDHTLLREVFFKIFDLIKGSPYGSWENIAKNLVSALVYETDEILKPYMASGFNTPSHAEFSLSNEFKSLVADNYKSARNLNYYASALNVSTNYLHKLIKKQTGKTPSNIINSKILNAAKALLAYSTFNISEIAFELGFSGVYAFSKFFKKQTGIAPSSYRHNYGFNLN